LEELRCRFSNEGTDASDPSDGRGSGNRLSETWPSIAFITAVLNEVNVELQKKQRQDGRSFVSRTTLESVYSGIDTVVLRAVPFNPMTTESMLSEILSEQEAIGDVVFKRRWKKLRANAPEGFETIFAVP